MVDRQIQSSFAAGELSPNLYARTDLAKYKVGLALARNFFIDFRGGASTRAGTQFVSQPKLGVPGQPRLIKFIVGQQNSYVLIFGQNYIWVIQQGVLLMNGSVPMEIATPYAAGDIPLLKITQSADVLTIVHPSYQPATLTLKNGVFTYAPVITGPKQLPPTGLQATATTTSAYTYGYVVTAVSLNGKEESIASNPVICATQIQDETKGLIVNLKWVAPTQPASLYRIYKWGPLDNRQSTPNTTWGYIGTAQSTTFTDNNIAPDFTQQPPIYGDPFSGGQIQSIAVNSPGSTEIIFGYVPITFTGDGTGAAGYATTNYAGVVTGCFLTNAGKNYTHVSARTSRGATFTIQLSDITPLFPSAASYYNQRLVYGGSTLQPETVVESQIANYNNFNTTPISLASDAINFDLATQQVNTIKSFQPVSYGLICFTTGGTFLLNGGTQGAPISPSSISANAQASNGANDLPPIQINYSVLYVQNKGNIVRDLSFAWQRQGYTGSDISTLSNHLFFNRVLEEWDWCAEPFKLVWVVRDDGVLLSLTYVPDQEIYAWAHHDTNGWFRSVVSIPEGNYDATYVIVQRYIGGALNYYIERIDDRIFQTVEDSWCLDCALSLGGNNAGYPAPTDPASILHLSGGVPGPAVLSVSGGPFIFDPSMIGYTLWDNLHGGKAVITGFTAPNLNVTILRAFQPTTDDWDRDVFLFGGTWSLLPNFSSIGGLSHLNGMMVSAVADGLPVAAQKCVNGTIELPQPASKVTAGLAYTCQMQTLRIEIEGRPTVQGTRKNIVAVTAIVDKALGLKMGPDFGSLNDIPELVIPYNSLPALLSTSERTPIQADWAVEGQVCFQQDWPLPATVLGLVPEVILGDTSK